MIRWYDRQGNLMDWNDKDKIEKLLSDVDYKRVDQTTLEDGTWISTVWLGLDHSSFERSEKPLIFETMVFQRIGGDLGCELDCDRYSTEDEAIIGHQRMVEKWTKLIKEEREI